MHAPVVDRHFHQTASHKGTITPFWRFPPVARSCFQALVLAQDTITARRTLTSNFPAARAALGRPDGSNPSSQTRMGPPADLDVDRGTACSCSQSTSAAKWPEHEPISLAGQCKGGTTPSAAEQPATPSPSPWQQQQQQRYNTLLLNIDPSQLPPVSAPDAAAVHQLLSSEIPPDLSRSNCPHLYYNWDSLQQRAAHPATGSHTVSDVITGGSSMLTNESAVALQQAAALLKSNKPVAIPTETVYGLAANALSPAAVMAVFEAKGRPADNPLIVHISDLDMLEQLYPTVNNSSSSSSSSSIIPEQYRRLVAAFWPGPLTLLLPTSPLIPAAVTAGQPTVAIRMPAHPVARALIAAAGVPLAAPSANSSGRPSPTTAEHVLQDLAGRVPAVVDGGSCCCGVESTVLDGLRAGGPVVLRPGGVTAEQLLLFAPEMSGLQVYSRDFKDAALEARPPTPGMKYRHYSPRAPVYLIDPSAAWQQQQQQQQQQHDCSQLEQQVQMEQQVLEQQVLEQQVLAATSKLLQELSQHKQQQQQQGESTSSTSANKRIVLLSTCSSSSSSNGSVSNDLHVGWTLGSRQALNQANNQQLLQQPILESLPTNTCTDCPNDIIGTSSPQQQQQQQHSSHTAIPTHTSSTPSCSSCGNSSSSNTDYLQLDDLCGVQVVEYTLGSWRSPEVVAQQLFAGLRAADAAGAAVIVVQGLPPADAGLAVMNRLHKAASRTISL